MNGASSQTVHDITKKSTIGGDYSIIYCRTCMLSTGFVETRLISLLNAGTFRSSRMFGRVTHKLYTCYFSISYFHNLWVRLIPHCVTHKDLVAIEVWGEWKFWQFQRDSLSKWFYFLLKWSFNSVCALDHRPCLVFKKISTIPIISNLRTYTWNIKCRWKNNSLHCLTVNDETNLLRLINL